MSTIPHRPDFKVFELPKLAVTATFASKENATFNIGPDGSIGGLVYVHVTDAQGFELPDGQQPRPEHFQLFEITSTDALKPVQLTSPEMDVEVVGALKDVVHRFTFGHTPDLSGVEPGQLRHVPFMLVVSTAGTGFPGFANSAGTTLLSAVVLNAAYEMQTRGGSLWPG